MNNPLILLILLSFFQCTHQPEEPTFLGKIQPRKAIDIQGSDLWIGGEVLDRDLCDYDAYKEYLGELGAKKIRLQSGWAKTEKEKGVYDFAWLDHIVDDAISRGVQPWIQLSYGNLIYEGGGGVSLSAGLPTSEEALDAWENYTKATVNRYKDRVSEWEIWNEADHRNNKQFGSDEFTYARLFVRTVEAIKSVQPAAKIVALSIAGAGRTEFVDGFFRYLEEHGDVNWVDVITFHGYPRNPDHNFNNVDKLIATASKYKSDIEFWQGETGCPSTFGSTGALSGHPWTELTQAKWNSRRALAHLGRGYPFSLFLLSEFVYNDAQRKGLNSKGILKIDESDFSIKYPKPAYFAYQHLTSIFTHELSLMEDFEAEVVSDSSVSVFGWQNEAGDHAIAYWTDSSIPSDSLMEHRIDLKISDADFREPVLVDVLTGEVWQLPTSSYGKEEKHLIFEQLRCHDAPLLIAEKSLLPLQRL